MWYFIGTYIWRLVLCNARYWFIVILSLECLTGIVYGIQKQKMEEPEMVGFIGNKLVNAFKTMEECPPNTGKLTPNLNPKSLNSGVMSRSESQMSDI